MASMSCTTPVDVSEWVTKTAAVPASAAAAAIRPGSRLSPHGCSTSTGSMPYARISFTHRSPKLPAEATTTRSSGDSRLATADSMAAVPDPVKSSTSFSVAKTRWSSASVSSRSARNSGLRWCCIGAAAAAATSGGIGVGPGVIR